MITGEIPMAAIAMGSCRFHKFPPEGYLPMGQWMTMTIVMDGVHFTWEPST